MNVRHRHLGRGNEVIVAISELEKVLLEFRELTGTAQRISVDDVRRDDFAIAARGVLLEKKIDERAIQSRPRPGDERETRARDFRRPIEVEDAERFADIPVRLWLKVEFGFFAPR